jgi:hypothetical protein
MANYLSAKELRAELIRSFEIDELTPEALNMFTLLSNKLSRKFSYQHPEDRQDCIQNGIIDCWMYWRNYNPQYNAFNYFTQVIKNAYGKQWRVLHGQLPLSKRVSLSKNIHSF